MFCFGYFRIIFKGEWWNLAISINLMYESHRSSYLLDSEPQANIQLMKPSKITHNHLFPYHICALVIRKKACSSKWVGNPAYMRVMKVAATALCECYSRQSLVEGRRTFQDFSTSILNPLKRWQKK